MVEHDAPVGEDHDGIRLARLVYPLAAALSLELVAEIANPAKSEVEWQAGRKFNPAFGEIALQPVEEGCLDDVERVGRAHGHRPVPYVGRGNPGVLAPRVTH